MDKQALITTADRCVQAFGEGAHGAIGAWREGGERLGRFAARRWDAAFEQSREQLSAETRRNAANARRVFARYYRQGLTGSAAGATAAVDTLVQGAQAVLRRTQEA